ncbi:probable protein phosphatase 2C 74 [Phragmites australis]|uniref:probable protein phosphatase 2C 74 n=1 Tax=Phragmites australis TaxID=29695 RepID=UPI002D77A97D|nr:probable protein phosphatase 2C 74 [Phragmites australis]
MMLRTFQFLCSVAAAFARLVRELRKAVVMAASARSPLLSVSPAALASTVGLIAATPLALRRKAAVAIQEQLLVAPPPAVVPAKACDAGSSDVVNQQAENDVMKKKAAWAARRRPSRLLIPAADDAGEVAASWGAAAGPEKQAEMEVEGEGFWLASRAGPRHAMEDGYAVITDQNGGDSQLAFYGVYDGHGGRAAVDFVSEGLGRNVVSAVLAAAGAETTRVEEEASPEDDAVSAAIRGAYLKTDTELLTQQQGASGGACAATALVKGGDLYVAHLGDCRAVLSRGGAAAALTADHTCAREDERARIEREGGYVSRSSSGVWRVHGSLAVSRAFGDGELKRWVVAEPGITRLPLRAGCEFLVIASDGLWDKVSNQEAVDAVARSRSRAASCRELVDMARRRGSRDDVTVMVVDLERFVR